jgi:hypothetical protein
MKRKYISSNIFSTSLEIRIRDSTYIQIFETHNLRPLACFCNKINTNP